MSTVYIPAIDVWLSSYLNQFAGTVPMADRFFVMLTTMPTMKMLPVIVLMYWLWSRPQAQVRSYLVATTCSAYIAFIVARFCAHLLPFRTRPLHTPEMHWQLTTGMAADEAQMWSSFPSDHATMLGAVVLGLWRIQPAAGVFAAVWGWTFILFPRLFVGLHFISDLMAGFLLGMLVCYVVLQAAIRERLWALSECWIRKAPGTFYAASFLIMYWLATNGNDIRTLLRFIWSALRSHS